MENIKILVSYDSRKKILKNEILSPIQVGRNLSYEIFDDMIGDNTGDNISCYYPDFKDLSSVYWAYKNYDKLGNPKYIGFMNSENQFIFNADFNHQYGNSSISEQYGLSQINLDIPTKSYLTDLGLTKDNILAEIQNKDLILTKMSDLRCLGVNNMKGYFQKVKSSVLAEDYDACLEIVQTLYPKYTEVAEKLNDLTYCYLHHVFIMEKSLFFEYCDFLFNVLISMKQQKKIDTLNYKEGFFSEIGKILLTIFVLKLKQENRIKSQEYYVTSLKNSFDDSQLLPKFKNKTAIACGCSDLYAPYLSVYLNSILKNSNPKKFYDIIVLETDISARNKEKLSDMVQGYKNVSLRFCNVGGLFANISLHISLPYFAKQCYYRLAGGKIFEQYHKVLFTDIDLVFNSDIADILETPMENYPLAACEEILWTKENRVGRVELGQDISDYISQTLDMSGEYFNTGVLLIDIEKFNNTISFEDLLEMATTQKFINQEQCLLNKVFDGKIKKLPSKYNFEIYQGIYDTKASTYCNYMMDINKAVVYHFLTAKKAWFYPKLPKADIWWKYARQTPFYEECIDRLIEFKTTHGNSQVNNNDVPALRAEFINTHFPNINNRFTASEYNTKLLYVLSHITTFRLKKAYYGFKKAFAFGKRHEKYQAKYDTVKNLLKDARKFKKQMMKV